MTRYKSTPFEIYHSRYDAWFRSYAAVYYSELLAVRAMLPWHGLGVEIGVGTGRFAAPLGIEVGLDPSSAMLAYAIERGIFGIQGVAEALTFKDVVFDYATVVTTICFVNDPQKMLNEAHRILKLGAPLVIGFVDRASMLGQHYLAHQAESAFYREARFYSVLEMKRLIEEAGFVDPVWRQTLAKPLNEIQEIESPCDGHGDGGFVVVKAVRS